MDAYITDFNLYSAKKSTDISDNEEVILDKDGNTYVYEKQSNHFINGGTADFNDKILVLKNICQEIK